MATQTAIIVQNEQELLHELVRHAYDIKKSDFSEVGKLNIYNKPPRSNRAVSFDGYTYTLEDGIIHGLNLPQQLMFLHSLSERFGIPLRHLTLRENFDAAYSPNGQEYKKNVLVPFWVYTGEMIEKSQDGYKVCRVSDVNIVTTNSVSKDCLLAERQQLIPKQVRVYKAGPVLQTGNPTESGRFNDFSNVIPVDSEIGHGIKGYWSGACFENDLSAVRCHWNSDLQVFDAYADSPLIWNDFSVLSIETDTLLNK